MNRSSSGKHLALAVFAVTSVLGLSLASGCNSLTGAEGLEVKGNAGGGGGAGGADVTTTTPPPVVCEYPTTGFSSKPGGLLPNHTWQGFVNESMEATDVSMADYLDCAGEKGVNGLLIDVSATWCGSCQEEAKLLTNKMKTQWDALGIRVLTLMIEDITPQEPATLDTALDWKTKYKLTSTTVAFDPGFFFSPLAEGGSVGLPFLIVVDPRTMTLIETQQGYPFNETKLVEIAKKNQTPQ